MSETLKVNIKVRRFDHNDNPDFEICQLQLNPKLDYNGLKQQVYSYFHLNEEDDKVIKLDPQPIYKTHTWMLYVIKLKTLKAEWLKWNY